MKEGHNPYFNRWFSAMLSFIVMVLKLVSHNPYFNRWFSAIEYDGLLDDFNLSHNPYFNRWFSAIEALSGIFHLIRSQSLF